MAVAQARCPVVLESKENHGNRQAITGLRPLPLSLLPERFGLACASALLLRCAAHCMRRLSRRLCVPGSTGPERLWKFAPSVAAWRQRSPAWTVWIYHRRLICPARGRQ